MKTSDAEAVAARSFDADALRQDLADIAQERDEAFRSLKDREAELALIQRIAGVGGVEVDLREGFRNRRSPEYLVIHGLPPDAANESHEDWVRRIHPDDRAKTERQFLDAIAGNVTDYHAEYRIVRPNDGQTRWVGIVAKIERDEAGRAVRLIGAHFDITDRMLDQERLRESEERFRQIADSAPVPMWVTRIDRKRAFANRAYVDFLGLPYQDALDFDWRNVLHPDDLPRILQEQIAGESSLKPFVLEARYRRADGQWTWLRSESQPRFDATGRHIGFIGVAHDVTAAKHAEAELRRLNEALANQVDERTDQLRSRDAQMRAIFETTHLYQALLDRSGNVLYANHTSLAAIDVTLPDVIAKPYWETPWFAQTPASRDIIRESFHAALRGENVRIELSVKLRDGDRFLDLAMRPVRDPQGKILGVVPEAIDMTERRASEEALRQSQKMEAIGQLTGGVAHDFNNLLTIIRSATDFLRRRDLPEERYRRYVDAIAETVERASKLIGQLLAFARRQPLTPQIFNVGEQAESIVQLIRPLVGSGIRTNVSVEGGGYFAVADLAQFETAIVNLAINARDAMSGQGALTIHVAKVREIPPLRGQPRRHGDFIAISVSDSGSGIPADKQQAIFEPFYTTKEVGKGTGLGLSQAFGFSRQSDGDIAVHSAPGEGATFIIYLPEASRPDAATTIASRSQDTAPTGSGYAVLVVEDNQEIGVFTSELLRDLGYHVHWVKDAEGALHALSDDEFAYDLVFSDIIMPGMNGIELATLLRDKYPGLPVVLTSGYSSTLAENAHLGFELIQKPYSVEVLSRTLRKYVATRRPMTPQEL